MQMQSPDATENKSSFPNTSFIEFETFKEKVVSSRQALYNFMDIFV